jgi:hypothetical protein
VLRLPESPRRRRRLLYGCAALAVTGAFALAQAVIDGSGDALPQARPGKAQVAPTRPSVPAAAADRAAAVRTLSIFVPSAFIRRDLAASWPLATWHMKADTSREEWLQGNLPVVPYPAAAYRTASFTLTYSEPGVLGYDVLVLPKRAGGPQQVYSCELHDVGGSWLVDSCYPRTTL